MKQEYSHIKELFDLLEAQKFKDMSDESLNKVIINIKFKVAALEHRLLWHLHRRDYIDFSDKRRIFIFGRVDVPPQSKDKGSKKAKI